MSDGLVTRERYEELENEREACARVVEALDVPFHRGTGEHDGFVNAKALAAQAIRERGQGE